MLMQQTIKNNGVASIEELRGLSQEADVKFIACQMTVDLFGFKHDDFISGLDFAGAATFLPVAQKADVSLFM
jgi:peroxiredoxin family protein